MSPPKSLSAYLRPPILEATSLIAALAAYFAAVALLMSNVSKLSGQLQYLEYGITYLCILLPLPILAGYRWISPKNAMDASETHAHPGRGQRVRSP